MFRTQEFFDFIKKRHDIYVRRFQLRQEKPWTDDAILQNYRFCNVYRELDTVTQWIAKNWRDPHYTDPDVWFAMVVARLVNWPDTLSQVGYPVPWVPSKFMHALELRKKKGEKVFTGAYMVRADATYAGSKAIYLATDVLTPLWEARENVRPHPSDHLWEFHERLMKFRDMGSFMAAQVVCDAKYTKSLDRVPDWWDWAASGPGSRRGLNRVVGIPIDSPWDESEWLNVLMDLHAQIRPLIKQAEMPLLHAQDLQNCLCEFDKYERVRLGEGRPRNLYPGKS